MGRRHRLTCEPDATREKPRWRPVRRISLDRLTGGCPLMVNSASTESVVTIFSTVTLETLQIFDGFPFEDAFALLVRIAIAAQDQPIGLMAAQGAQKTDQFGPAHGCHCRRDQFALIELEVSAADADHNRWLRVRRLASFSCSWLSSPCLLSCQACSESSISTR